MSISFKTDTVTVLTPVMVTDHGTQVPDWDQPPAAETLVEGCRVQPLTGDEELRSRDGRLSRFRLLGPPGMPLTPVNHVRLDDGTVTVIDVDVEATVRRQRSPTGFLDHTNVVLKIWEG